MAIDSQNYAFLYIRSGCDGSERGLFDFIGDQIYKPSGDHRGEQQATGRRTFEHAHPCEYKTRV
jgi:hypothetical protein